MFVWVDLGHRIQLDRVPDWWLLQGWMGTSVEGVNPVALELPIICQVSILFPLSRAIHLLARLHFGSHPGYSLSYML